MIFWLGSCIGATQQGGEIFFLSLGVGSGYWTKNQAIDEYGAE